MAVVQHLVAVSMTAAGVAAVSSPTMDGFTAFAERFGITAALLLYFVWRDTNNQKRADKERDALVSRLQSLEESRERSLTDIIKRATSAMNRCHAAKGNSDDAFDD